MAHSRNPNGTKQTLFVFHTECMYTRGGEKYLFEILKRLAARYTITLYVHAINAYWYGLFAEHGIRVKLLWTPRRFYWLLLPVTLLVNVVGLRREIAKHALVIATNFPVNTIAVSLSDRTICHCFEPLGVFYDARRIASLPLFSRISISVAKFFYAPLDKQTVRKSAVLTTLNPSVTPHIQAVYQRTPDIYVPNGIDATFFTPRALGQKRRRFTIGHSTDYTVFKGTEKFIAGLAMLKHKTRYRVTISETRYDGAVRKDYEKQIRELGLTGVVRFVGNLTESQLLTFYRSCDVFCYTGSPHSAGGATASLSVLEAQACGIPIIRSIGNTDEIVQDKTGFYINPDDPADIARNIMKLSDNTAVRQAMGKEARRHILTNHGWDRSVRRLHMALRLLPKTP